MIMCGHEDPNGNRTYSRSQWIRDLMVVVSYDVMLWDTHSELICGGCHWQFHRAAILAT
jgi:hypothetical protein